MSLATRGGPSTSAPGDGSRTITIHDSAPREEGDESSDSRERAPIGALRLRGGPRPNRPRVVWSEDTIDNEGCGRKKSKICCIYHKPKAFDESSDEDSSDSDSDCCLGDDNAQPSNSYRSRHNHSHTHDHSAPGSNSGTRSRDQSNVVHELEGSEEPNAYESIPSSRKGKKKA